jgi:hypothetical protein
MRRRRLWMPTPLHQLVPCGGVIPPSSSTVNPNSPDTFLCSPPSFLSLLPFLLHWCNVRPVTLDNAHPEHSSFARKNHLLTLQEAVQRVRPAGMKNNFFMASMPADCFMPLFSTHCYWFLWLIVHLCILYSNFDSSSNLHPVVLIYLLYFWFNTPLQPAVASRMGRADSTDELSSELERAK